MPRRSTHTKDESVWVEWASAVLAFGFVLGFKAATLALRSAAQLTAAVLPAATSTPAAIGSAALAGGAWMLLVGLLVALVGGASAIGVGLLTGSVLGGCIGSAVYARGRAQAAAHQGNVALGGRRGVLGVARPHVIDRAARVRHLAVFGPTGSGKSTALTNIALQDAAAPSRPGILCIDIKDDFALSLLDHLPPERRADILLFDPSDTDYPPAFNPLADIAPQERTLATAELLGALKRLSEDAWGPRLEHVLRHVLLTLVETPDATMLDIARLLTDERYRTWAVDHVSNFSVKVFWQQEYPAIVGKGNSLANVASLLNKLSVFSYPEVRNVVGQTNRGLDLDAALARGQIVLAHLPQGVLGEDIAHFFAALLVGKVQLAAQRRVQLAHAERTPFYVFADEFQTYDTSAFTKLITEGRSMGVGLVVACQFREQLPAALRLTVEKNCAYALQCHVADGRHRVEVLKLQEPTAPDASTLLTPLPPPHGRQAGQRTAVRQQSRAALARPRSVVEAAIAARLQPAAAAPQPIVLPVMHPHLMASPPAPPPPNGAATNGTTTGKDILDRYEPL